MTKKAPHLPNQTCRVDTYYRLQNIKWILLFSALAFLAGGSAAMAAVAWFLPSGNNIQFVQTQTNGKPAVLNAVPESLIKNQTEQRLLTVYDKRKKTSGGLYGENAFVALAPIISSDGWAVSYLPSYAVGQESRWELFDSEGGKYFLEKTLLDKKNGLVYLKIKAQGLRVVAFSSWKDVSLGSQVWSLEWLEWKENFLQKYVSEKKLGEIAHFSEPIYSLGLMDNNEAGAVVVNNQGQFLGFVSESGDRLVYSWQVEKQIGSLLTNGALSKDGKNNWEGYFIYGDFGQGSSGNDLGFYILNGDGSDAKGVKNGDIILAIDGNILDKYNLAWDWWQAPSVAQLSVWRGGEVVKLDIQK